MLSVFSCSIVPHFHVSKIIDSTRLADYELQASPYVRTHRVGLEVRASCLASYVDFEGIDSRTLCLFARQFTV